MSRHQFDRGNAGQRGRTGDRLSPNDPSEVGPTKAPLYTTKINQESAKRVRIGDPLSPVEEGDVGPKGKPYRRGQYAPTIEELSTESIETASQENLLSKKLPIFSDGEFDKEKLDSWNPNKDFRSFGTTISSDVPKYSSAVVLSTFLDVGDWLENLNIAHIFGSQEISEQPNSKFGDLIVQADSGSSNRKFQSNLRVFPKFYKYVSIPLKNSRFGEKTYSGVSVASYAVLHSIGHIVFSKLSFDGKLDVIGNYIDYSGWEKRADINVSSGSYMGYKNPSVWKRSNSLSYPTELSKYSPMDDFSESFALYYANTDYLQKLSPNRFSIISDVTRDYGAN